MNLLWVDVETTGVDRSTDEILEVGVCLTEPLPTPTILWESSVLVLPQAATAAAWEKSCDFVREMHRDNGLWSDLHRDPARDVDREVSYFVRSVVENAARYGIGNRAKTLLCGQSVHFDRGFLELDSRLCEILGLCTHRNLDVSTVLACVGMTDPGLIPKRPKTAHRPLDDLHDSIDLLVELWQGIRGLR